MSLHRDDTRGPEQPIARTVVSLGSGSGPGARGDPAPEDPTTPGACTVSSLSLSDGEIVVLRVAGEIDLGSDLVLRRALDAALAGRPGHLVVDLSELRFCSVRGMSMLVAAAATAAAQGTQYVVSAVPGRFTRFWSMLWPVGQLPIQFSTAAAGVVAAQAHQKGARDGARPRARRRTRRGLVSVPSEETHARLPSADQSARAGCRW